MNSFKTIVTGFILTGLLSVSVVIAADVNSSPITGEWNFISKFDAMNSDASMTITKDAQGKYSGTWSAQWGESTLSDITVEGNKVKFVQTSSFGGQDMKTDYQGTLDNGKVKGTAKGRWGDFSFEGTRSESKDKADVLAGEWQMNIMIPAREIVDKMTITKNQDGTLSGTWQGTRGGENTISNLKYVDGKLTFTRTSKMGGTEFSLAFDGTVTGDTIKGTFSSDFGERPVTAVRASAGKTDTSKTEPNKLPAEKK